MNLIDLKFGHNLIMQSNRTYINYNFYFFICYVHYNGLYLSFKDDDFMFLTICYISTSARETTPSLPKITSEKWIEYARTAFSVDPRIALSLASRFPTNTFLKAEMTQLVQVCFSCLIWL